MLVDINQTIKGWDGESDLIEQGSPLTLADVFLLVVNSQDEGERLSPQEKRRLFSLGVRIATAQASGGLADLSIEDAAVLLDRAGRFFIPLVYGRVCEILDR